MRRTNKLSFIIGGLKGNWFFVKAPERAGDIRHSLTSSARLQAHGWAAGVGFRGRLGRFAGSRGVLIGPGRYHAILGGGAAYSLVRGLWLQAFRRGSDVVALILKPQWKNIRFYAMILGDVERVALA